MLTISDRTISEIAECKERNDHTEALLIAARVLGLDDVKDRLRQIAQEHARRGGDLKLDVYHERYRLYEKIMQVAKRQLLPAAYEKFHGAF